MANIFVFSNLARSSLAGAISTTDPALSVQAGGGSQFPNPAVGQQFALTITDAATGLLKEIVYCTKRTGDTMSVIVRGQEGYPALNWNPGDPIANLWTAGQAAAMLQQSQAQAQTPNYAVDVGTTNAYVGVYNPTISVPTAGMPLRLKIGASNSGPSTFNPGSGLAPIVTGTGSQLSGGELRANMVYEFMWNGAAYELMGPVISSLPAGMVVASAGTVIPAGWLACQGQSLLRASYPDLFAALGTTYGAADGSHFSIPNLSGRVIAGVDPSNSILSNPYVSPSGNVLGAAGGAQSETTTARVTGGTSGAQSWGSTTNAATDPIPTTGSGNSGSGVSFQLLQPGTTVAVNGISLSGSTGGQSLSVSAAGPTDVQTNVQPTLVLYYIIKVYN
jgi:microcystin-dependent protein